MPEEIVDEVASVEPVVEPKHVDIVCGRYDTINVDVPALVKKNDEQERLIAELQAKLAALAEIKLPKEQTNDEVDQAKVSAPAESPKGEKDPVANASGTGPTEASKEVGKPVTSAA